MRAAIEEAASSLRDRVLAEYNEKSAGLLIKQVDSRLVFSRNYGRLRPCSVYCEEMVCLSD